MMKKLNLSSDQKLSTQELMILKGGSGGTKSATKMHNKWVQQIMA